MPTPSLREDRKDDLEARVALWRECGRNTTETARRAGLSRGTMQNTIRVAYDEGIVGTDELHSAPVPGPQEVMDARTRKLAVYARKRDKGTWRKPSLVHLPDGPFRLKVFGDPHLDADGCNFELFERHWLEMNPEHRVYGVCVGDWFNNWVRALAHLWKDEAPPSDAWTLFEHLMEERGEGLIGACSGNHDDWTHAPADPVDMLMKRHGVRYRKGAIRLAISCGDAEPFTVAIRHKWKGNSIYSAAHGIRRAVEKGWQDLVAIGGHIHQDEPRLFTHPDSGEHTHICQISAFKDFDEYVDIHGFMGQRISPVWDLVIDPRLPGTDPDKVKIFWDGERAAKYLASIQ